jgi:hypothetical protein
VIPLRSLHQVSQPTPLFSARGSSARPGVSVREASGLSLVWFVCSADCRNSVRPGVAWNSNLSLSFSFSFSQSQDGHPITNVNDRNVTQQSSSPWCVSYQPRHESCDTRITHTTELGTISRLPQLHPTVARRHHTAEAERFDLTFTLIFVFGSTNATPTSFKVRSPHRDRFRLRLALQQFGILRVEQATEGQTVPAQFVVASRQKSHNDKAGSATNFDISVFWVFDNFQSLGSAPFEFLSLRSDISKL